MRAPGAGMRSPGSTGADSSARTAPPRLAGMDRTSLADELRAARFRTTQFRTGYDEGSVDDLIDLLAGQLVAGAADHEIVATVEASRFPTTTARRGYETADVDAL